MASSLDLPATAFTLTGGCFCKSIRYAISVPALEARPRHERPAKNSSGELSESLQRWPVVSFDHCNSCRKIAAAIVQPWLIFPTSWASWTLVSKAPGEEAIKPTTIEVLKPSEHLKAKTHVSYFSSSEEVNRIFCGKCGTGLTFFCDGEDPQKPSYGTVFDIALGSLDDECLKIPGMRPRRQSWVGSGISWVKNLLANGDKAFSA
ncbi:hypothetical protein PVAG01_00337 [Phlyctema vagabunda]|uniref:CENP-V/GFA domain-containing protein n=1 Tax=Phlyctema vagabunda TaxID=108571 RepID=A0ABR4PTZ5_9HELO